MFTRLRRILRLAIPLVAPLALVAPVCADETERIRAYVTADGATDPATTAARVEVVRGALDLALARHDDKPVGYRRARALHRRIQRVVLRTYDEESDRLDALARHGMHNCLSAVLFYGLAYERAGYRPEILAFPGHLMVRIHIGDRAVDIETTSADGFDVGWFAERWGRRLNRQRVALPSARRLDPISRLQQTEGLYWRVPLDEGAGLARLNEAWDALDRGALERASRLAADAASYMDELARQTEGVRRLFERAHGKAYEAGRFELAYRIARDERRALGPQTSTIERLSRAAARQARRLCEGDRPRDAWALLDELRGLSDGAVTEPWVERQLLPLIVASAVRNRRWQTAVAATARYAAVEPDPVEVERLRDWLAERRASVSSSDRRTDRR